MTTETENKAAGNEQEQSVLPTVLAGAGILAVAALLIFWPSDDDAKTEGAKAQKAKAGAVAAADDGAAAAGGAGGRGVASRPVDAPTTPATRRMNPDIKLPSTRGMAPAIPEAAPADPPPDATPDEKIAFYEKRLEQAVLNRDNRKKFADKLPDVKARIEASPNAAQQLQTFEQREKIVQENLSKAEAEVAEIERKLAELRGA